MIITDRNHLWITFISFKNFLFYNKNEKGKRNNKEQ